MAEGPRATLEALGAPMEVAWTIVGESYGETEAGRRILAACRKRGQEAMSAPDDDVRALCSTDAPQPVLLAAKPPPMEARPLAPGRYLLADAVQTPGNLGALARSAWGFGLDGAVVGEGTVDPWNAKAVRASAGAAFRIPFLLPPDGFPVEEGPAAVHLLYADPGGDPVEAFLARAGGVPSSWVLAVGNESRGVSAQVRRRGRGLAVPLAPGVGSLNAAVAGSILLYLLAGARRIAAPPISPSAAGAPPRPFVSRGES